MKTIAIGLVLGVLVLGGTGVAADKKTATDEKDFVWMFNGKDLTGWEGVQGAWFVEDGAITAESTPQKPCKSSHYLYWKGGEPGDFVLRLKMKLVGGNSGVQFRSKKQPKFGATGYQADFDAQNDWTGCLYQDERGAVVKRGQRAAIAKDGKRKEETFASFAELGKKIKKDGWNDYEITAQGSRITLRLNGELMCEADDQDAKFASRKGIIALQMHQGPRMKVQFKDLRIKMPRIKMPTTGR
jgi:hypothetical protein